MPAERRKWVSYPEQKTTGRRQTNEETRKGFFSYFYCTLSFDNKPSTFIKLEGYINDDKCTDLDFYLRKLLNLCKEGSKFGKTWESKKVTISFIGETFIRERKRYIFANDIEAVGYFSHNAASLIETIKSIFK